MTDTSLPLAAGELDPRSVAAERAHQRWHLEHGTDCDVDPDRPLHAGCEIRWHFYRLHHDHNGTALDLQVATVHPRDLPLATVAERINDILASVPSNMPNRSEYLNRLRADLTALVNPAPSHGRDETDTTPAAPVRLPVWAGPLTTPAEDAVQRVATELETHTDADGTHVWWGAAAYVLEHAARLAGAGLAGPHQHVSGHDPATWHAKCCACETQHASGTYFNPDCGACQAIRDQDRPYVDLEWAVRHPNGVLEQGVPEGLARRSVAKHPSRQLLARTRIRTPDIVSDYTQVSG